MDGVDSGTGAGTGIPMSIPSSPLSRFPQLPEITPPPPIQNLTSTTGASRDNYQINGNVNNPTPAPLIIDDFIHVNNAEPSLSTFWSNPNTRKPTTSTRSRSPTPRLDININNKSDKTTNNNNSTNDKDDEPDYLQMILTARVYDIAKETPLTLANNLSARLNNQIYIKREDLQPVFSFKLRGAYNRMCQLSPEEKAKGVITASAGNHAMGVAMAAQKLGIQATIVMPVMTPPIKWKNVKKMNAQVVLHGNDFDEAKAECYRLAEEKGLTFIPPYDDPYVIAGQGTIATEILRQIDASKIDAIFCCVGGGGLISGVASYVKRLFPHIKIIGVETYDSDAMTRSLQAGQRVFLKQVGLFADGAAVRLVGKETFRICQDLVDEMVLVSTDEICAAIRDIFEDTRSIVEPAGALGVAGAKRWLQEQASLHNKTNHTVVAVTSGANMNFDRLRFVNERAEVGEGREVLMSAIIPEEPGSFNKLYQCIHPRVITEFSYRYGDESRAHIFLSFTVNPATREQELLEVFAKLQENGMEAMDISHDEVAKSHARYLVGGKYKVS